MKNYLAVALNGSAITIFDIPDSDVTAKETEETYSYKIIATLEGHNERVVCLSWSPHMSGYLVSGS